MVGISFEIILFKKDAKFSRGMVKNRGAFFVPYSYPESW